MDQIKIGKFILENRKLKKMTQSGLAEILGVTDRTISNWENGKNMPDLSLFKPLCDTLGITINELMSGEKIEREVYNEKLEENIINTIDYIDKKNLNIGVKKCFFWLFLGVLGIVLSNVFFTSVDENYLSVISMIITIYSIKCLFIKYRITRRIVAIMLVILCFLILIIK